MDLWFEHITQVANYDVRRFAKDVMIWQGSGFLEPGVIDEIAVHLFPQLVPQTGDPITELEIDRTNFTVTYEQGRMFLY